MGFPDFFHEGLKFVKAEPHYHEKVGNLHHWRVYFAVQNADSQLLADDYVYIDLHRNNPETLMGCEYCTLPVLRSESVEPIFELTDAQLKSLIYRRGIGDSLVPMLPTAEGEVQVTELGVMRGEVRKRLGISGFWFGVAVKERMIGFGGNYYLKDITYLYRLDFDINLLDSNSPQKEILIRLKTSYEYLKKAKNDSSKILETLEKIYSATYILRCGFTNELQAEKTDITLDIDVKEVYMSSDKTTYYTSEKEFITASVVELTLRQGVIYQDKVGSKTIGGNSSAIIEMAHGIGHLWAIYSMSEDMKLNSRINKPKTINGSMFFLMPFVTIEIEKRVYEIILKSDYKDIAELESFAKEGYLIMTKIQNYQETTVLNYDSELTEYLCTNYDGGELEEWIAMIIQNLFATGVGEMTTPMVSPNEKQNAYFPNPNTVKYKSLYPWYNVASPYNHRYRYQYTKKPLTDPTQKP